jgi:4,5-DOPA dioxygenase extradiol
MSQLQSSDRGAMPAVFLGHGNPMNAIQHNAYTDAWSALAGTFPRPRQVLSISAHWYLAGTRVTVADPPRTIHDFGGFPKPLFDVQYPARGSAELARRTRELLAPTEVTLDTHWGLDHGTWSLLVHLFPEADVPVVQLSLDEGFTAEEHFDLARRLQPLRDEGVLLLGSGNVVHNLDTYAWGRRSVEPYEWALRFETQLRTLIAARAFRRVAAYDSLGRDAALAVPTPEHFLPLLYVLAQWRPDEPVTFPVEGFDGGSVSMLGVRLGPSVRGQGSAGA